MKNHPRFLFALFLLLFGFSLGAINAFAGQASGTKSYSSSPDAGKLAINEINIVQRYIEFYVNETVDINGWLLRYEGQGQNDGSAILCSAPPSSSACTYSAGTYLVVEGTSLHSTLEELIILDENDLVVHYFRYANSSNQAGGNWLWQTDDPALSTIYYVNGNKNNLCAKPNGSLLVKDWGECTPTKGGDNYGPLEKCENIFPGDITFAVNGSNTFFSYVDDSTCNGGSCGTINSFVTANIPALAPSGSFTSTSLTDGEYHYSSWGLASNSAISFSGNGTAVLYFNSSITIPTGTQLNVGGNPSNVLIVVNGALNVQSGVDIYANIYVTGSATIGDPNDGANITGALSVGGALSVYGDGVYQYATSYVNNMDTHGFCEATPEPVVDHYEIIHDGNGLTCEAETITIRACTSSIGQACVESSQAISLDLLATGASNIVTTPVNYTGNSAVFVDMNYTVAEVVTLSIANASVTALNGFVCNNGNAGDCNLTFSNAGFKISGINDIEVAGVANNAVTIQAVKDDAGVCVPLFNDGSEKAIEFAVKAISPVTIAGQAYKMGTVASHLDIPKNIGVPSSYQTINLTFDNTSTASLPSNVYLDAGIIDLYAKFTVPATADNPALTIVGNSGQFTVRPDSFRITPISSAGKALNESTATGMNTQIAGEGFDLKIEALNVDWWGDGSPDVTENYTDINVDIALQRIAPEPGYEGTLFDGLQLNISSSPSENYDDEVPFTNGRYQSPSKMAKFTEVGIYKLYALEKATLVPDNSSNKAQGTSYLGRFIPAYFEQTVNVDEPNNINDNGRLIANHNAIATCSMADWVYSGQKTDGKGTIQYGIEPKLTITAKNANGDTTKNYIDEFVKLSAKDISLAAPFTHDLAVTGVYPLLADNSVGILSSFTEGQASFTFSEQHHFTYTRNDLSKVAPFIAKFEIPINTFEDSDQVSMLYNSIEHKQNPLFSKETPNGTTTIDNSLTVKFGRLAIDNAYGPETENLPVPMYTQYWDGDDNGFVTNIDDSCTTPIITGKDETSAIRSGGLVEWQYRLADLDNNDLLQTSDTNASVTGTFSSGVLALSDVNEFWFSAPNDNKQGSLEFEYQVPTWLQYDWVTAGGFDENPTATITFGLFRGNDRIISWREVGN